MNKISNKNFSQLFHVKQLRKIPHTPQYGFTLIELLVVVAILGLLVSIILIGVGGASSKARITKAQSDLNEIKKAISLLEADTNQGTNHMPLSPCVQAPTFYLDIPAAGIQSTDGLFPTWQGPYIASIPKDPWGQTYIYDYDYRCLTGTLGCEGVVDGQVVRAIHSGGPNKSGIDVYDVDNIVLVLCR